MNEQIVHHYPPEVLNVLIDAVPRLLRSKQGVLDFFRGCGVETRLFADIEDALRKDRQSVGIFEIARKVLVRLNDRGDDAIRARREVVRKVSQWDDFSSCYENRRAEAEGYVAKLQKLVEVKDSFVRMAQAYENESEARRLAKEAEVRQLERSKAERVEVHRMLNALFFEQDHHRRGTALETVLNRLFKCDGMLVRDQFRRNGNSGQGVIEQIDGVVEVGGVLYLVEMKWWDKRLGRPEISEHLVRVYGRANVGGIVISNSGFTKAAIEVCREAIAQKVCVLIHLADIVSVLEQGEPLGKLFKSRISTASLDKNPYVETHPALSAD